MNMDALFSQFSYLANEALDDKNFNPTQIEQLLEFFEHEAHSSWSAAAADHQKVANEAEVSMKEAEDHLNSLLESAMSDYYKTSEEMERSMSKEVRGLVRAADSAEKAGRGLGAAAGWASQKYMDAALALGMATMKKAFTVAKINKVHPS